MNSPPAFPHAIPFPTEYQQGMTLRDYFAAAALTGIMSPAYGESSVEQVARESYEIADAMLKAREQ